MFGDDEMAHRILNSNSPFEAKKLSRKVKNSDMNKWKRDAQGIAVEGVYNKFKQNEYLCKMLMNAKTFKIVEASRDRMWGVGVPLHSDQVLNEDFWNGDGLMKTVYDVVKEMLK